MVARPANPPRQPLTVARRAAAAAALTLAAIVGPATAQAAALGHCTEPAALSAAQHDRLLRFTSVIRTALQASGESVALVSRSGTDLDRFGQRYSHAGISLRASADTPWAVRQLYFDCNEGRPRLFDQGLAAFVQGMQRPALGFVSVVLLPAADAAGLETHSLDTRLALALLSPHYSANAHAFSTRYQNCNQWVAELLATAWRGGDIDTTDPQELRTQAQSWLEAAAYMPTVFEVGSRLMMWLSNFSPWLHSDDHPPQDIAEQRFRVSMPASLEALVQRRAPTAQRLEFCHTTAHVVVRRGWQPLGDSCQAGPEDTLITLD